MNQNPQQPATSLGSDATPIPDASGTGMSEAGGLHRPNQPEPDQIDQMSDEELRTELRALTAIHYWRDQEIKALRRDKERLLELLSACKRSMLINTAGSAYSNREHIIAAIDAARAPKQAGEKERLRSEAITRGS